MPYNPGVENKAGQIYGNAVVGAAQARSQGIVEAARTRALIAQQNQQNLFQGISSAASAIGGAFQQYNKDKINRDFATGQMEFFANKGIVSPEEMSKFSQAPYGKQAAMVVGAQAMWENFMKTQQGQENLQRQIQLKQAEHEIDRPTPMFQWQEGQGGQPGKYIQTGTYGANFHPTSQPNVSNQPEPMKVQDPQGNSLFLQPVLDSQGNWTWPKTLPDGRPYTPIPQKNFFGT